MLVQGVNERFAPLLEWRQSRAANQPTYASSLGLFHPVCLVPVTFVLLRGMEIGGNAPISFPREQVEFRPVPISLSIICSCVIFSLAQPANLVNTLRAVWSNSGGVRVCAASAYKTAEAFVSKGGGQIRLIRPAQWRSRFVISLWQLAHSVSMLSLLLFP